MPVNSTRKDYDAFVAKWERLRDCFGGRDTIIAAGTKYVPVLNGASIQENVAYRNRGNFYNAVQRTTKGMVGMLFQKDILVDLPARGKMLAEDVTLANVPLPMFAFTAATETLLVGRYGVLVDMTSDPTPGKERPYLVGYAAEQIVNWSTDRGNGDETLTRVVLQETYEEPDPKDEFVCETRMQYRVLRLVEGVYTQQIWRKPAGSNDFAVYGEPIVPQRRGVPLPFIPFVFLGPLHVTSDLVNPPMLDLADVNIAHWRNSVDYEYGLHLVALPTPWVAGMKTRGDNEDPLKIGPSVVWELDVNGTAGMLEFQGSGMESLHKAMSEKKAQMATLGARLMEDTPRVQETATSTSLRHSGDHATLRSLALSLEQGITLALKIATWWISTEELPAAVKASITLNKDYLNIKATPQEVQVALAALQAGKISYETFWHILLAGGWAREGVTAEDEKKQIETEEPELPEVDPLETPPDEDEKDPAEEDPDAEDEDPVPAGDDE